MGLSIQFGGINETPSFALMLAATLGESAKNEQTTLSD